MRVLLIEDDRATAQSIELMLKSANFNVYTTDLGGEGSDLGKLYDYDIILLDLNLLVLSGFDIHRRRCKVEGSRSRRRHLNDKAVPQGRTGRAHQRDSAPLSRPRSVGRPDR